MAVDATLWFIFAGVVALIYCGCVFTAPKQNSPKLHHGPDLHPDLAAPVAGSAGLPLVRHQNSLP